VVRRRVWAGAVALVLFLWGGVSAVEVRMVGSPLTGFELPFDFAPMPRGGVAVLEDRRERVVLSSAPQGRAKALPGPARPGALAIDETGLLVVLEGQAGDREFSLVSFRGAERAWRAVLKGDVLPGSPVSLAARDGVVWLVDRSPPRVFVYAYDGERLGVTELAGLARSPFAVALGPAGEAFISDPMGPAVLALNAAGAYVGKLSLEGTGVTRPTGLAVEPAGRVWVSDGVTGHLACLDPGGKNPDVHCQSEELRFEDPLRLGWADGALWVLEARPGRVRRIQREGP